VARPPKKRPTTKSSPRGKAKPAKKRPARGKTEAPKKRVPRRPPGARRKGPTARVSEQPGERLQKILAAAGIASRRECEELILEGRVQVDGQVVTELGSRVDLSAQEVHVDGDPLPRPRKAYFAVNKPTGVVSTASDPSGRPRVTDLLPPSLGRLYNVGRLDMASEGLILVTNDGELANRLTHPSHGVEKTYNVEVAGLPGPEVLDQLRKGVYFAEGKAQIVRGKIKSRRKQSAVLEIVLAEGRNREIRRMLAKVGHKVQRLIRVSVGPVKLGDMPPGSYRKLSPQEVQELKKSAKM
jgi:23S rRNA pseudouridine2605 synthase